MLNYEAIKCCCAGDGQMDVIARVEDIELIKVIVRIENDWKPMTLDHPGKYKTILSMTSGLMNCI